MKGFIPEFLLGGGGNIFGRANVILRGSGGIAEFSCNVCVSDFINVCVFIMTS